ncbi:MAG: trypsin-like peptidase domain-containing protein [Clostridia bacterium]|nr:trypsin-like peptidase domain-containing protein [Clostridia bacterium]
MKKLIPILALLFVTLMLASCGVEVTFDIGEATLVSGETVQKYKEDTPVVPPEVSRDGYVFVGWEGNYESPTEPTTVTPVWKKLHTVTFVIGDAITEDETVQQVVDGEAATEPLVLREGYVFDGWDRDFSNVTEDTVVTALWKKIHTVTIYTDGGTATDESLLSQRIVDGEAATPPTLTKDKYVFAGWDKDITSVTEDMTVTALWERKIFTATEIFSLINPGTVEVTTYRLNRVPYSLGSGFFIDEDGLLITNYHVIEDAREIEVKLSDETVYTVTRVVGYDKEMDIAILKADTKGKKVAYLEISSALPTVGEAVYAIGSSLGLTGTFSSGIVSYVNRTVDGAEGVKFIQTTTPISSGNSGGPLVNEKGYVIGINSASYTEGQNLNLAIEISQYKTLNKVDMTVEELFQKEGTLKWYIGEMPVKESSDSKTGQIIPDGATVQSRVTSADDLDLYYLKSPKEESVVLVMMKTPDPDDFYDMYLTPVYNSSPTVSGVRYFPESYYFGEIVEGEDGTYCLFMVVLTEDIAAYDYIGLAVMADKPVSYEMFVMTITEEMAEALS